MLKSHQIGDLTPAETKVDYLRFAKVLYEERNGFKRFGAANGGTLLSRSYFLKERKFFHSLLDPVFKNLSSAIKEAIFGQSLLIYLETIRQVAKIDHAQGQILCSNTCTLFFFQNLFSSSYFLSWQRFLR